MTITPTSPTLGLDYTTGEGNVPDSLRGFAAAGVRGLRSVQPRLLDTVDSVHVTANGEDATFPIDDLDDLDTVPGIN